MGQWEDIRRQAQRYHAEMFAIAGSDTAAALLATAQARTGIRPMPVSDGDSMLFGAQAHLDAEAEAIWYNNTLDPSYTHFVLAHEFAHHWLEGGATSRTCSKTDIDPEAAESGTRSGIQRVEGYSPVDHRERMMNIFAREFLLPADKLRRWYLEEGLGAEAIATRVGVPEGMVYHQLVQVLLVPRLPEQAAAPAPEASLRLDHSQAKAAHATKGPLLVEAGPGTGKTRTLTARIAFLLQSVDPANILALTFSNRAAAEMRERVALVAPEAAPHIWMGTFHAFGLELLRKHGDHLGLPRRPRVLDPVDAMQLLEEMLPQLGLVHYQNLYEPTTNLGHMLKAISRAKDELITPAGYQAAAQRMMTMGGGPEAEKALEVAHVYALYQERLEQDGLLDFGDLIARSVELLRTHPAIRRAERRRFRHILVDEYQDVNRASGMLLQELAGDGRGLWVVGDVRQSIYRFRGAAPTNVQRFKEDFPNARDAVLARNYRSRKAVLDTVSAFVPLMRVRTVTPFEPWELNREDAPGELHHTVSPDLDAECAELAQAIEQRRAAGMAYREQAILCRSHTVLARIAQRLEQLGVPVVYLGDVFERPEIRDLLSLLQLACEGRGVGLVRVARFPSYQIPLDDVLTLLRLAREQNTPFPQALALADTAPLSDQGRAGLQRLAADLEDLCYGTTAWSLLVRYLFGRSDHIRDLIRDESTTGQQRRLAILQFLLFAYEQRGRREPNVDQKRSFLRYVRRLEMLNEERQLRQIPEAASAIDAVQLMTVHAAKGLEFPAVYLPGLGKGMFPLSRQGQHCPPPPGLLQYDAVADHDDEEECLFFVALSRARDALHLSRADRYTEKQKKTPSDLLERMKAHIGPAIARASAAPTAPEEPIEPMRVPVELPEPFEVRRLDQYLTCPRQLYYEVALGLSGRRDDEAYQLFHRCVRSVISWVQSERANGRQVDEAAALSRLNQAWLERGPRDHAYEMIYRASAERILGQALRTLRRPAPPEELAPWIIPLDNGTVQCEPDHIERADDGTVLVQRLRTGKLSDKEKEKDIYALYLLGAAQAYNGVRHRVEIKFLSTDETDQVDLSSKQVANRRERYQQAIDDIRAGVFPPKPNERECPRCPFYFICPAAEEA